MSFKPLYAAAIFTTMSTPLELYAIPFSCSLAPHLALHEAGLPHRVRWVTRGSLLFSDGGDFRRINPKAKVPALRLSDGECVTECPAVLFAIADLAEPGTLAPPSSDARARRRQLEWLTFIGTELHKQILFPTFDPLSPEERRRDVRERLMPPVLAHLGESVSGSDWLQGSTGPWVADFYLFWALMLLKYLEIDLSPYGALRSFEKRMRDRPAAEAVLELERSAS
jgi:glutathione S-transferase